MKYLIIGVIAFAIVAGFAFWKFGPNLFGPKKTEPKAITLTVYGLWEDDNLMRSALDGYKKLHPNVTVKYVFQSSQNYRSRVQTLVKEGQGPDIFMIHNTWVPMFIKTGSLYPAPETIFSLKDFSSTFYPVSKTDLTNNNRV